MKGQKFPLPRKSLGQNFLQDDNIIRKIVDALEIGQDDVVAEIGPGRGALTEHIIGKAAQTHLIEFDRDLASYWLSRSNENPSISAHQADVLDFDFDQIISVTSKLKVIGNLPYNISSPILFHLLPFADDIERQIVMLQNEVVDRMAAEPGSKQFGRLSVMIQYRYHVEKLFAVSKHAFIPPPKVESAIAKMVPRAKIENPVANHADFELLVKSAFSQRRKTLRNSLSNLLDSEQIEEVGIDPSIRPEKLQVQDFVFLANLLSKSQSNA